MSSKEKMSRPDTLPVFCPSCGKPTEQGFGLAGGGYGPYCFCSDDNCNFFAKICLPMDSEL